MDRHSSNAPTIAEKLVGHPKLGQVYYPGLPDHPGHELATRQVSAWRLWADVVRDRKRCLVFMGTA